IDSANNAGSAVEFNQTLQKALSTIKNVDAVIGGHTPTVVTWNDFRRFTEFYSDFFSSVRDQARAGKKVDEVSGGDHAPRKYQGFRLDADRVKSNVQGIYDEFKK